MPESFNDSTRANNKAALQPSKSPPARTDSASPEPSPLRRSKRKHKPSIKYRNPVVLFASSRGTALPRSANQIVSQVVVCRCTASKSDGQTLSSMPQPTIFAPNATTDKNDVLTYRQEMKAHDSDSFVAAMKVGFHAHIDRGHWRRVRRSSSNPKHKKTLCTVWSFKRKRRPDDSLLKHKARLCVNGAMQQEGSSMEGLPRTSFAATK